MIDSKIDFDSLRNQIKRIGEIFADVECLTAGFYNIIPSLVFENEKISIRISLGSGWSDQNFETNLRADWFNMSDDEIRAEMKEAREERFSAISARNRVDRLAEYKQLKLEFENEVSK